MLKCQLLPFDLWLRKHVLMGANVVKPALASLTVEALSALWQKWLGGELSLDVFVDDNGEVQVFGQKKIRWVSRRW